MILPSGWATQIHLCYLSVSLNLSFFICRMGLMVTKSGCLKIQNTTSVEAPETCYRASINGHFFLSLPPSLLPSVFSPYPFSLKRNCTYLLSHCLWIAFLHEAAWDFYSLEQLIMCLTPVWLLSYNSCKAGWENHSYLIYLSTYCVQASILMKKIKIKD